MRLRLLLTFGLFLCMASIASSNESRRFCGHVEAKVAPTPNPSASSGSGEYSTLLVNKLLYI